MRPCLGTFRSEAGHEVTAFSPGDGRATFRTFLIPRSDHHCIKLTFLLGVSLLTLEFDACFAFVWRVRAAYGTDLDAKLFACFVLTGELFPRCWDEHAKVAAWTRLVHLVRTLIRQFQSEPV